MLAPASVRLKRDSDGRPVPDGALRTLTGGIVHPVGHFAGRGLAKARPARTLPHRLLPAEKLSNPLAS